MDMATRILYTICVYMCGKFLKAVFYITMLVWPMDTVQYSGKCVRIGLMPIVANFK